MARASGPSLAEVLKPEVVIPLLQVRVCQPYQCDMTSLPECWHCGSAQLPALTCLPLTSPVVNCWMPCADGHLHQVAIMLKSLILP